MVPANRYLVSRNEQVEVEAKKSFYENIEAGKENGENWRMRGEISKINVSTYYNNIYILFQPRCSCRW